MRTTRNTPLITRPDRTVHFLTDVHCGAINSARTDKLLSDAALAIQSAPVLRVHGGDVTNEDGASGSVNTVAFDNLTGAFITGFTDGVPYAVGIGNHDVFGATRTCAQFCTGMTNAGVVGLSGKTDVNQVFSLGTWGKAIVIGDDQMSNIAFTQATLDYLETQLTAFSTLPCLIFAHPPLEGTFGSINSTDVTNVPVSTDPNYFSKRQSDAHDTYIRTLLGNHANAKAWISGHCHPHPTFTVDVSGNQTVNQAITVGSRQMAHIIGGGGYHTHPLIDFHDPVWCAYITYFGDVNGGTVEIRHRDSQNHSWVAVQGQTVNTITVG